MALRPASWARPMSHEYFTLAYYYYTDVKVVSYHIHSGRIRWLTVSHSTADCPDYVDFLAGIFTLAIFVRLKFLSEDDEMAANFFFGAHVSE